MMTRQAHTHLTTKETNAFLYFELAHCHIVIKEEKSSGEKTLLLKIELTAQKVLASTLGSVCAAHLFFAATYF